MMVVARDEAGVDDAAHVLRQAMSGPDADSSTFGPTSPRIGYLVQDRVTRWRVESGETLAGFKIGLTNPASQERFQHAEPCSGRVFSSSVFRSPATYRLCARPLHFEVEVGLVVGDSPENGLIVPVVEIVSSRWQGGTERIGPLIADNVMATGAVIGEGVPLHALPNHVEAEVEFVGKTTSASSNSVLDNVSWLRQHLANRQLPPLTEGQLVLTGSIVSPQPIPGNGGVARAKVHGVGSVAVTFVPV